MNKKNVLLACVLAVMPLALVASDDGKGADKPGVFKRVVRFPLVVGRAVAHGVGDAFSRKSKLEKSLGGKITGIKETGNGDIEITVAQKDKDPVKLTITRDEQRADEENANWWLRRWAKNATYLGVTAGVIYAAYKIATHEKVKNLVRFAGAQVKSLRTA